MKILYGFFSGIGDLVSALPVINSFKPNIKVTLAVSSNIVKLLEIFSVRFNDVIIFDRKKISKKNIAFFYKIYKSDFKYIIYSPHAMYKHSSFLLPIFLKAFKKSSTKIIGAEHQKNSWLFNKKENISFSQKCTYREFDLIKNLELTKNIEKNALVTKYNTFISNHKSSRKSNLISIHVGASRQNRIAPDRFWVTLINKLCNHINYEINIIGLKNEISGIQELFGNITTNKNVSFISGSLSMCTDVIVNSRLVVTMDSGFGHIASSIGVKHLCIFSSNSAEIAAPIYPNTTIISQNEPCQPCLNNTCHREENYCLTNLDPNEVYCKIIKVF